METTRRQFRIPDHLYERIPLPNRSEFVRDAISEKLLSERNIPTDLASDLRDLRMEIRKIGVNINQLARSANIGKNVKLPQQNWDRYYELVNKVDRKLDALSRELTK